MLKEAEAAAPAVGHETMAQALQANDEIQARKAAHAQAGVAAGSVEAGLLHQSGLPQMGEYLRQQYDMKKRTRLKKTGSKEVDDMLRVMGFII